MPTLADAPCLLALTFRAVKKVGGLGFVFGHQAGAALKHVWTAHGPGDDCRLDVSLTSPDAGRLRLQTGERLTLGLALPQALVRPLLAALDRAETAPAAAGAIAPGLNLSLVDVRDRLAGGRVLASRDTLLHPETPQPLTSAVLDLLAARLRDAPGLFIGLASPLRLPAPADARGHKHRYADAAWLQKEAESPAACALLGQWLARDNGLPAAPASDFPNTTAHAVAWLDMAYGIKTMGGIGGGIETGPVPGLTAARWLALAHCLGAGKNRALGLGQVVVSALESPDAVMPLERHAPLPVPGGADAWPSYREILAGLSRQIGQAARPRLEALLRDGVPSAGDAAAALGVARPDIFWRGLRGEALAEDVPSPMAADPPHSQDRQETGQDDQAGGGRQPAQNANPPGADEWKDVFDPAWRAGRSVYLTARTGPVSVAEGNLVIEQEEGDSRRIALADIGRVVVVGRPRIAPEALFSLLGAGIVTDVLSHTGQAIGQLAPAGYAHARLRPLQEQVSRDPERLLDFSRNLIAAKLHNQRRLLARHDHPADALKELEREALVCRDLAALRGVEGAGARLYFQHYAGLVSPWAFEGRSYRPPLGPVNALLSLVYSLLHNRFASTLLFHGFDARFGYLHQGRGRHAALASDMMEPFRVVADRLVLRLLHKKCITENDVEGTGGAEVCRLRHTAWKTVIQGYEKLMARPFSDADAAGRSLNERLDAQVQSLNGWLRGSGDLVLYRMR